MVMKIIRVAETNIDLTAIEKVLTHLGAPGWKSNSMSPADYLAEFMGRLCYKSFEAGLNLNVTKVREGNAVYLANLQKQRHGSVFEHASVSFVFLDVSRILTHELVRHRVGISYSQESQRFVRLDNFDCYIPNIDDPLHEIANVILPDSTSTDEERRQWVSSMAKRYVDLFEWVNKEVQDGVGMLIREMALDGEGVPFHAKKTITSALRRMVPSGVNTNIGVSANHRTWRYLMETRSAPGAEIEIREAFVKVGGIMVQDYPNTYQDAIFIKTNVDKHDPGYWTFANSKI
jgi:thymidylate synthase (FAD)